MSNSTYETFSHLPEISAGLLRVLVLDHEKSGIDSLEPWVRFRIEDAAKCLQECQERIEALEKYVSAVVGAEKKAFRKLAKKFQASEATHATPRT
jgi:hypothetical protein